MTVCSYVVAKTKGMSNQICVKGLSCEIPCGNGASGFPDPYRYRSFFHRATFQARSMVLVKMSHRWVQVLRKRSAFRECQVLLALCQLVDLTRAKTNQRG
jgi:hypothetical protein